MSSLVAVFPKRLARVLLITCLLASIAIVYVTLFKHPPPDQVLKMNGGRGSSSFNLRGFHGFQNPGKSGEPNARGLRRRESELENEEMDENDVEEEEVAAEVEEEEEEEENEEEEGETNILGRLDDDDDDVNKDEGEDENVADEDKDEEEKLKLSTKTVAHVRRESGGLQRRKMQTQNTTTLSRGTGREQQLQTGYARGTGETKKGETKMEEGRKKRDMKQGEAKRGELKGKAAWEKFVAENHHTVIGIVFDRCEDPSEQLGTVVMLPDPKHGGVMSRTFYNFTLDREISEGLVFKVEVKYNGQELYDNWWEVCEMEENLEPQDRTFHCPVKPGPLSLVKDKHVPGYIPKGRYETKAWVEDGNHTVLLCGYSNFVL